MQIILFHRNLYFTERLLFTLISRIYLITQSHTSIRVFSVLARHRFHRGYVEVSGVFFEEKKEGWGGAEYKKGSLQTRVLWDRGCGLW